ncbi:hypothetical protein [Loktanella sp. 3ANDIMAR09]|uniref:hypothetical protein n=1 Tax=Loktanella sp. 3ANDIMAR09 TaxID=1225657 RepID=UPI00155E5CCC|nr:hypothetical protein [Loktanella sp. 3ANDIMAR09]
MSLFTVSVIAMIYPLKLRKPRPEGRGDAESFFAERQPIVRRATLDPKPHAPGQAEQGVDGVYGRFRAVLDRLFVCDNLGSDFAKAAADQGADQTDDRQGRRKR